MGNQLVAMAARQESKAGAVASAKTAHRDAEKLRQERDNAVRAGIDSRC